MTVISPPSFQTVDGAYTGASLGVPYRDFISEGVAGPTDLAVAQRAAGANLSVDVAAGVAWVKGDDAVTQPVYRCYNDAVVNLAIATANATNPRVDRVIAEVRDSAFSGVNQDWRLRVITGTPAGVPVAPALPSNAISLATVSVPALDTTISTAQITDTRPMAMVGATGVMGPATVTSLPPNPYDGQEIYYVADATNGIVWRFKYRAASASPYKWEFVGGPPLIDQDAALAESTASSGYTTLTTATQLTAPLAGVYDFRWQTECYSATTNQLYQCTVRIGSESFTPDPHDYTAARVSTQTANNGVGATGRRRGTVTTAGTNCQLYFKASGGASGTWQLRYLEMIPVRVG